MLDFMSRALSERMIILTESWVNENFVYIAIVFFLIELIRYSLQKRMSWNLIGDSVTNFTTLFFLLITIFFIGLAYLGAFVFAYEHLSFTQLPITGWTILGCLILADLAYYWEHRFLHNNGLAWGTHSVHHSSVYFNISVAYRFGPLDWFFPFFFHIPLVLMGFNPFVVLMCETLVQLFQTLLHTESVRKLPKFFEAVFNTPSHHRVHHATNKNYLDKNYGGIFIIWDRMFGTFAREEEPIRYGILPQVKTVNPFKVYLHGYGKLIKQLIHAPNLAYRLRLLTKPPIWIWEQEKRRKQSNNED